MPNINHTITTTICIQTIQLLVDVPRMTTVFSGLIWQQQQPQQQLQQQLVLFLLEQPVLVVVAKDFWKKTTKQLNHLQ